MSNNNMDWDDSLDCDESFEDSYDGGMDVSIEEETVRLLFVWLVYWRERKSEYVQSTDSHALAFSSIASRARRHGH